MFCYAFLYALLCFWYALLCFAIETCLSMEREAHYILEILEPFFDMLGALGCFFAIPAPSEPKMTR